MNNKKRRSLSPWEHRAGNHILRCFHHGDPHGPPRWELSRVAADGAETVIARGVGHDLPHIRKVVESTIACRTERDEARPARGERAKHTDQPKLKAILNPDRELVEAVINNDRRAVSRWLKYGGASPNARDKEGRPALLIAAERWCNPAIAKTLLAEGADVQVRDRQGMTPLHAAAFCGDLARIELLLDYGAEINARDATGWTPLHFATRLGRIQEAALLVRRGADTMLRNNKGRTPLEVALENHFTENMREPLMRLLGQPGPESPQKIETLVARPRSQARPGVVVVEVLEALPNDLVMKVNAHHDSYKAAEKDANQRGLFAFPYRWREAMPDVGERIKWPKGLSPTVDAAWEKQHNKQRAKALGIKPVPAERREQPRKEIDRMSGQGYDSGPATTRELPISNDP